MYSSSKRFTGGSMRRSVPPFVTMTTSSLPLHMRPSKTSILPPPYESDVSNKVTPTSRAFAITASAS